MPLKNDRPVSAFFIPEDILTLHEDLTRLPYLYDETGLNLYIFISMHKKIKLIHSLSD